MNGYLAITIAQVIEFSVILFIMILLMNTRICKSKFRIGFSIVFIFCILGLVKLLDAKEYEDVIGQFL